MLTSPFVVSVFYTQDEASITAAYAKRQCIEYAKACNFSSLSYFFLILILKLGMLGTSVLYGSGDNGVAGLSGLCVAPSSSSFFYFRVSKLLLTGYFS